MSAVYITEPPDGTVLDYDQKKIRIRWDSDSQGAIKAWKIYLGSENGRWDLLMSEQGASKYIDLDPHYLPLDGELFAQVSGVYDGKGKNGEEMEEHVVSEMIHWTCPGQKHCPGHWNKEAKKEPAFAIPSGGA